MVLRNLYQVLEQCALLWISHQSCMCPVNPLSVSAAAKLLLPEVVFVSTMKNWNQTWCGDNERWFLLSKARSCWCPLSYVEAQWMKFHFKLGLLNTWVYVSCGSWQEQASMWDMWTGKAQYIYSGMRSNVPFYTIHSDVWGPCETTPLNGYRWFLTFIDCSSRYTWLYVMKKKSHVYSCFAIKQWWTSIMHKFRCLDRKEVVEVLFHITILKGKKNKPIIRIPFHLERRIWLQILLLQSILLHPQMGMRCRDPPWHLSFFMFLAYCPYLGWKQRPSHSGSRSDFCVSSFCLHLDWSFRIW